MDIYNIKSIYRLLGAENGQYDRLANFFGGHRRSLTKEEIKKIRKIVASQSRLLEKALEESELNAE
jgi:hypothetical protein